MENMILIGPYVLIIGFILGILITLFVQNEILNLKRKMQNEKLPISHYILSYSFKMVFVSVLFFIILYILSYIFNYEFKNFEIVWFAIVYTFSFMILLVVLKTIIRTIRILKNKLNI